MDGPRMTTPMQLVLRLFLDDPAIERYGLDIGRTVGLMGGTVHPILCRLERMDPPWLTSRFEDIDPAEKGRARRRYYRLTDHGTRSAARALARSEAASGPPTYIPQIRPAN
jgi:PadR family transcriptional regulator, regulatory protein PadR